MSTRIKLLDAALASFSLRGFHGTSTRDIAEAAGMSPAAVYTHFQTKEDLLFRLSLAGHTEVRDVVLDAAASSDDPVTQVSAIAVGFVVWHATFHTHARVVQYELGALTPDHFAAIAALRRETQACLRDVIERGAAAEMFDLDDGATVARAIMSLGIDVARWYVPSGLLTPQDVGRQYAELALRLVGASATPRSPRARR